MVIVDTFFLFSALNINEESHEFAVEIWEKKGKSLKFPVFVLWEFILVLKSRNKSEEEIKSLLQEIKFHIQQKKSEILPMTIDQLIFGIEIFTNEMKRKNFFDSLIAGCARDFNGIILSDDTHFDVVKGIRRLSLFEFKQSFID
ncbi:MAG: type II toxin-antitoxin system VapC family toxin [Candidatus Hodarchaeales archaeon]